MAEVTVIIIGAGPSGLATAASLTLSSIPYVILEREDCSASLWRKRSYDRLHLHLPKQFCELPNMAFPTTTPSYVPKAGFVEYLDRYMKEFRIQPIYGRNVEKAEFNGEEQKRWKVRVRNLGDGEVEEYCSGFLVVATGESAEAFTPAVEGIEGFGGHVMHSTEFKSGKGFEGKNVLVVGAGNSGMEIAFDLSIHAANTSLLVRSPVHILSRRMVHVALVLMKYLAIGLVDSLMVMLSKLVYGDLTKHGMSRPVEGPMFMKVKYGKYPVIDVGAFEKIKSGQIQVLPTEISSIKGNNVLFKNGKSYPFDSIIFCTGFKRSTNLWLKGDEYLLNEDGLPKPSYPNHWKGKNGLYCVGLSRRVLLGANSDAQKVAQHISSQIYMCDL